jgi:hypothetical protein
MSGFSEDYFHRLRKNAMIVAIAASAVSVLLAFMNPTQFFQSYLVAYIYWLGIPLGCTGFLMISYLTGGGWAMLLRPYLHAGARTMTLLAVLFLPIFLGLDKIYPWFHPHEAHGHPNPFRDFYLSIPFFHFRAIGYFILWIAYAFYLSRPIPRVDPMRRFLSAIGLVLMALSVSFASVDWAMSLEPHWFSTIYGMYYIVGSLLTTLIFGVLTFRCLYRNQIIDEPDTTQLHDVGNLMLACTMLWGYATVSQFIIIWHGNLAEEIPWYLNRSRGGWDIVAALLIICHFAIPFVALLMRRYKRDIAFLAKIALWYMVARMLDLTWLIVPAFHPAKFHFHILNVTVWIAIGAIWFVVFSSLLKQRIEAMSKV